MKCRIICSIDTKQLEEDVNEFLKFISPDAIFNIFQSESNGFTTISIFYEDCNEE